MIAGEVIGGGEESALFVGAGGTTAGGDWVDRGGIVIPLPVDSFPASGGLEFGEVASGRVERGGRRTGSDLVCFRARGIFTGAGVGAGIAAGGADDEEGGTTGSEAV